MAVARVIDPRLRSYPVAVATAGTARRALLDISVEAREAGLYKGMLLDKARRACRDLIVLNPMPRAYERALGELVREGARFSPRVETAGPGHVFVDLTGTGRLFGKSVDIAERVRRDIAARLSLPGTIGLGGNKLISKIATRVVKPAGLCTVLHGCEDEFLAPLPVRILPGIEGDVVRKLVQFNINIIKELRGIERDALKRALGNTAREVDRLARGIDDEPVRELTAAAPSVREEAILREQSNDAAVIRRELFRLVARAGMRLRAQQLAAGRITVEITYSDGGRAKRSVTPLAPISGDLSLYRQCESLLSALYTRRVRLMHLMVHLRDLTYPYGQIDLFANTEQEEKLMGVMDEIRHKFGEDAIRFWGRCRR